MLLRLKRPPERPLDRLPPRGTPVPTLPPPRVGVDGFCFSLVGVEREALVLASGLLCSISLPLSSTTAGGGRVGFRPRLGLLGTTSSVEAVEVESCLASSFSTSTSSVSLSSAGIGVFMPLFRPPLRCVSPDADVTVVEGDDGVAVVTVGARVTFSLVILELFRELGSSESSSSLSDSCLRSLSVSFLLEDRLLCLLSAGDPVREPLEVTDEGVPALELSLMGPLEEVTIGLGVSAEAGGLSVFSSLGFFKGVILLPPTAEVFGPGFFLSGSFASTTGSGMGMLMCSASMGSSLGTGSTSGNTLSLLQDKFSLILDLLIHSSYRAFQPW